MGFGTFNLIVHSQNAIDQVGKKSSNSFKVMIVLEAQEDKVLLDGLLHKILSAIKIDMAKDVCLIKKEKPHINLNILKVVKDLEINQVISFGLKPKDLDLNFSTTFYKPLYVGDKVFLFVDALSVLAQKAERKKALWDNLQQIFLTD